MQNRVILAILVSALGYFVDVYDLVLFNVVRVKSLQALHLSEAEITSVGMVLLNIQLIGLLIGGLLWGILGDKKGRVSVLFGSIFLYSCANIANAFVTDVNTYALCRFLTGIGLGGEFGVGVTLVSELMPKEKRGYGTMVVAVTGIFGAIASGLTGDTFSWQTSYIVGGLMGFALLALRIGISESKLFEQLRVSSVSRGSLKMLFKSPGLLRKYLKCIAVGAPIWLIIGLFMALAPELGRLMGVHAPITAGRAILFFNIGFGSGELLSSLLSQWLKSRKKAILTFLVLTSSFSALFLGLHDVDTAVFYSVCTLLGLGAGYWAVFMMVAAEQFGTNLRATVATSVPNFVRALVVPCTLMIGLLRESFSLIGILAVIQCTALVAALFAQHSLAETFGKDLDFIER